MGTCACDHHAWPDLHLEEIFKNCRFQNSECVEQISEQNVIFAGIFAWIFNDLSVNLLKEVF